MRVLAGRAEAFGVSPRVLCFFIEFVAVEGGFWVFVVEEGLAGEGLVLQTGGLASLGLGEALQFAIENEFGVLDEIHSVGVGKLLGAGADEIDVRTFFKDEPGGLDRVAEPLDAGDATGFHAATVHNEGVELDPAIRGEEAAATCVEGGVIFKDSDGGFNGVKCRTAEGEDLVAGFEGIADTDLVGGGGVRGDGPGTAVDEKCRVAGCWGCHGDMVAQGIGREG